MKLEMDRLVTEILDQLPIEIWANPKIRFLDPAIGGGQFVRHIEQRLRAHGATDRDINRRVYGLEETELHVRYAVNKHGLSGQYRRLSYQDFFKLDDAMKFDVIVGNPPYQDPNNDKKMIWNQILDKCMHICAPGGIIAMITPTTWLTAKTNIHNSYRLFEQRQVVKAVIYDRNDRPFEEGTTVSYTITHNEPRTRPTALYYARYSQGQESFVADVDVPKEKVWPSQLEPLNLAIHNKLRVVPKIKFTKSCEFHNQKLKKKALVSDSRSKEFPYTHHVSSAITRYTKTKFSRHADWKVMVPLTSTIDKAVIDRNCGHGEDMLTLYVDNEQTASNIQALFKTKFYRFIGRMYKNGRNQPLQNLFPRVDFSKSWTDAKLYKKFGLTAEEIEHIETNYK